MNIFNVIIILLILLSGAVGLKRGVLKEVIMFIGTILVYIISFQLKGKIGVLLCKILPFFKLDGLVTLNILIDQLIAFIIIASILFGVYNLIIKLTGIIQKLVDLSIILTLPSKILGFIIGMIEGYIVIFILLIVLAVPLHDNSTFKESSVADKIIHNSPILTGTIGGLGDMIVDTYKLTNRIEYKENDNINSINLELMQSYLKYNIISREDALKIIDTGKLDSVQGIRSFVESNDSSIVP